MILASTTFRGRSGGNVVDASAITIYYWPLVACNAKVEWMTESAKKGGRFDIPEREEVALHFLRSRCGSKSGCNYLFRHSQSVKARVRTLIMHRLSFSHLVALPAEFGGWGGGQANDSKHDALRHDCSRRASPFGRAS